MTLIEICNELKAWAKDDIVPSDLQKLCLDACNRIEQAAKELEQSKKEVNYQQAKINIRDSHLRERCEKVRQCEDKIEQLEEDIAKRPAKPEYGEARSRLLQAMGNSASVDIAIEKWKKLKAEIEQQQKIIRELVKAPQKAIKTMESAPVQANGEWETGMFCGLEDRRITDRYEACRYGYDSALEKVQEWIIDELEPTFTKAEEMLK